MARNTLIFFIFFTRWWGYSHLRPPSSYTHTHTHTISLSLFLPPSLSHILFLFSSTPTFLWLPNPYCIGELCPQLIFCLVCTEPSEILRLHPKDQRHEPSAHTPHFQQPSQTRPLPGFSPDAACFVLGRRPLLISPAEATKQTIEVEPGSLTLTRNERTPPSPSPLQDGPYQPHHAHCAMRCDAMRCDVMHSTVQHSTA
ncbi:hypothetical protein LY78DRAFT_89125 [Colletotrichum sublineola]|nr:hypothetical protein LY78DRAFT_89125 [Colletotrichum sublineola]